MANTKRFLLASVLFAALSWAAPTTPLDDFIAKPDDSYAWKKVSSIPGLGYTGYVLELTSQMWRTKEEVDQPLWKHWLIVIQPAKVAYTTGFLVISGGNNKRPAPEKVSTELAMIATATQSVIAELRMAPNQPLVFTSDPQKRSRSEDAIIAYTWDQYIKTNDPTWPGHLPMTKAAVRAMDAVTAFCAENKVEIKDFVVGGGSKRGWTTWLTGAADKRVVGIVPIVIDVLNVEKSMRHHFAAYGFWAPAIHDYVETGVIDKIGTEACKRLFSFIDPYVYRDRLTMPKYMVCATGDQFFLPDGSQFYFDDLKGEKFLRYVPNADHSLAGSDAWQGLIAFYQILVNKKPFPKFSWEMRADGAIVVKTVDKPAAVKLWQATNPKARDFRVESVGRIWTSSPLEEQEAGVYVATVPKPEQGWTAFLVELTFPNTAGALYPFVATTAVRVTPDTLPFADKLK
jgi:PhoPQ-activated pathogenicity-related protein